MARIISIYRRRVNLVDLVVQNQPNAISYQFWAGTNFDDAAPVLFATIPAIIGYRSPSVPVDQGFVSGQFVKNVTRFRFNPADYTATVPAIADTLPMFINLRVTTPAGTTTDRAYHLILPPNSQPQRVVTITGSAPAAATIAGSTCLRLPMLCNNWQFKVNSGKPLSVAFEPTSPEWATSDVYSSFYTSISEIFVRGEAGGVSNFSATFTLRNNPTV